MGLKITSTTGTSDGNSSSVYLRIQDYFVRVKEYVQLGIQTWKNKTERDNDSPNVSTNKVDTMYMFPIVSTAWAATTAYSVGDLVVDGGNIYQCNEGHTSQSALSDDNSKWDDVTLSYFAQSDLEADDIYAKGYAKLKARLEDEGNTVVDENN